MAIEVEQLENAAVQLDTAVRATHQCEAEIAWLAKAIQWTEAAVSSSQVIAPLTRRTQKGDQNRAVRKRVEQSEEHKQRLQATAHIAALQAKVSAKHKEAATPQGTHSTFLQRAAIAAQKQDLERQSQQSKSIANAEKQIRDVEHAAAHKAAMIDELQVCQQSPILCARSPPPPPQFQLEIGIVTDHEQELAKLRATLAELQRACSSGDLERAQKRCKVRCGTAGPAGGSLQHTQGAGGWP